MSEQTAWLLIGIAIGVLLMAAYSLFLMLQQDRRHRDEMALARRSYDPALQNAPAPKAAAELAPDELNTMWIKHSPYHWKCTLLGDYLEYWPTTNKWRWRHVTYTGSDGDTVEDFILRRMEEEHG